MEKKEKEIEEMEEIQRNGVDMRNALSPEEEKENKKYVEEMLQYASYF